VSNQLITPRQAAEDLRAALKALSPPEQALAVYVLQTSLGGFPRDEAEEERLFKAIEECK